MSPPTADQEESNMPIDSTSGSKRVSSLSEFGSRILKDQDKVFEFNAWDCEEMSPEMLENALEKIQLQTRCENPERFNEKPADFWNQFYLNNQNKFFKDRHWLKLEFPELFASSFSDDDDQLQGEPFRICEIGCGAGNTVFPFLQEAKIQSRNVFAYACDYSAEAIKVVQSNPLYDEQTCKAMVYDITSPELPDGIQENSLDICICIFVLSAIHPRDWEQAVNNLYRMLKPGGMVLLRDYGRYDLAQIRMKKDRLLDVEHFYRRGDGTRVYFFSLEELDAMFSARDQFQVVLNASDKRLLVNRKDKLKMFRCWQQGKYKKK